MAVKHTDKFRYSSFLSLVVYGHKYLAKLENIHSNIKTERKTYALHVISKHPGLPKGNLRYSSVCVFHYLFANRTWLRLPQWQSSLVPFGYSICILFLDQETYPKFTSVVDRGQYTSINAQKKLPHGDNLPLTHANPFPNLGRTLERRPNQQLEKTFIRCQIYLLYREFCLVLYLDGLSWMGIIIYQLDCWSTRASQTGLVWYVVLEVFFRTDPYVSLSMKLDGFLARQYNMSSVLGTILDPAADKILMTTLTVTLTMQELIPRKSRGF